MPKNFGPAVSGYLVPTGRSFETVVYQAGKPVLDRENNLLQDVDGGAAQDVLRRSTPSGWISDDFTNTSDPVGAIFSPLAVAETIEIPNGLVAHVNGWMLKIQHTGVTGSNQVSLSSGPVGFGAQRTDIVVLEVWRRLVSASPSTDGKSAMGRIWQQGNVATDPANDAVLNYPDDILDVNVGSETTKRVQIQYRLRGVQNVNTFSFPYGLDDPAVVANSVPPSAAFPDGTATVFPYVNQSSAGDPGLWIAGDGNPANTLGTVDGYMYCIPLLAVFRRNQTAFDRRLNQNGGVASPGPSDRPDGLFQDIFAAEDIADLRHGVSPTGWSYAELLEKNTNYLLDNSLRTEFLDTSPFGGGYRGTTVFMANEIGSGPTTGVGEHLGQFDAVRRRFSDRSIFETVTVVYPPPFGGWVDSASFLIQPSALPIYPYSALNWDSYAGPVRFLDVLEARWIGPILPKKNIDATPHIKSVSDLAKAPITALTVTFGTTVTALGLTNEPLYVTLLVGYPTGEGLSRTPVADYGASSFSSPYTAPNFPYFYSPLAPVSFAAMTAQDIDFPHREVQLEYETVTLTFPMRSDAVGTTLTLPERAATLISNLPAALGTLSASGRVVTIVATPNTNITVMYTARRPMPQNNPQIDAQFTVYFRAAAPQSARAAIINVSLTVVPKVVSKTMLALTTGSGSQDEGYPFSQAYVQTGGISNNTSFSGESEFSSRSEVSVADFNASTGLLNLPVYVPMVADPQSLTFTRGLGDIDIEGRTYFPTVPAGYIPNAYAQDLSNPDRHKDILPILAELAADSQLGHKGQLVLVLLIRYAIFDETNGVWFDNTTETTVASVFRIKGNLLSKLAQ
jgi:hypothetical protein